MTKANIKNSNFKTVTRIRLNLTVAVQILLSNSSTRGRVRLLKIISESTMDTQIFDCIAKSDITELKAKLTAYTGSVDFTDENGKFVINSRNLCKQDKISKKFFLKVLFSKINFLFFSFSGMTPLQHASYKGNKEAVQLLLDLVSLKNRFLGDFFIFTSND